MIILQDVQELYEMILFENPELKIELEIAKNVERTKRRLWFRNYVTTESGKITILKQRKKYSESHRELINLRTRIYHYRNKERLNQRARERYQLNGDKVRAYNRERYHRKKIMLEK